MTMDKSTAGVLAKMVMLAGVVSKYDNIPADLRVALEGVLDQNMSAAELRKKLADMGTTFSTRDESEEQ
jgi:hypothetical protein